MTNTSRVALVCAVSLLAGCTEPAVALKPLAVQESAVTVRDWNRVALAIADQMSVRGLLAPPIVAGAPATPIARPYGPYYVQVLAPGSTFLQEVAGALRHDIMRRGGTVLTESAGATVINLDADVVQWGSRPLSPGGMFTALGAAAGVADLLADGGPYTPLAGAGLGLGGGLALDAANALTPNTRVEVVWQASIVSAGRVRMDLRQPIYVSAHDVPLYASDLHFAAMTSPGRPMLPAARRLRVDP